MVAHDHDRDPGHEPDRDPGREDAAPSAPAPAPVSKAALEATTALQTVLNGVDTAGVIGRSGLPLLLFKSRDNNGTWYYGAKKTIPEIGSLWAVNPNTFQRGGICWGEGNKKKLGERMLPVSLPMVDFATLPDLGFPWQVQWGVNMKCLSGADRGAEVVHMMSTDGGVKAIAGLLVEVRERLNGGQHNGKIVPVVLLEKDSYPHGTYGKTWYPVLTISEWTSFDGPVSAPPPEPPPASNDDQPRRRRVG